MKKREIKKLLFYSTNSTVEMIPDMETLQVYKKLKPKEFNYHFVIFPDGTIEGDVSLTEVCRHGNPDADKVAMTVGVVGGMVEEDGKLVPAETLTPEQRDIVIVFIEQQIKVAKKDGVDLMVMGCNEINLDMPAPGFDVQEILRECEV